MQPFSIINIDVIVILNWKKNQFIIKQLYKVIKLYLKNETTNTTMFYKYFTS